MAQDKKPKSKVKIVLIIVGVVWLLLMVGGIGLAYAAYNRHQNQQQATANRHDASAKAVQASLDLYYVLYGKYPSTTDMLVADMRENKDTWPDEVDPQGVQDALAALQDLDYSKRGDSRAYRLTYTNVYGERVTVEGNYSQDYQ